MRCTGNGVLIEVEPVVPHDAGLNSSHSHGKPTMTPRDVVTHDEVMTGTFHDRESAEAAYQDLIRRGYKPEEAHLIMSAVTRKRYYADTPEIGSKAASGGMAGATVGGAVGAVAAVLAAAGTL